MTSLTTCYSQYDAFAFAYDRIGYGRTSSGVWLSFLEEFILPYLSQELNILDLCCGQGELVQRLISRGYKVVGIDGSEEMLYYARKNAPDGHFIKDDARFFQVSSTFDLVCSAYNGFAHIISFEEVVKVFQNVYDTLIAGGWFAFDLSREENFQRSTTDPFGYFGDDYAMLESFVYKPEDKLGQTHRVIFQLLDGNWLRSDINFAVKPYEPAEVQSALEKIGFREVNTYDAELDLGIKGTRGRMCYICRKLL